MGRDVDSGNSPLRTSNSWSTGQLFKDNREEKKESFLPGATLKG
jgi:hypothetical protein